jgi:hypothetical protein
MGDWNISKIFFARIIQIRYCRTKAYQLPLSPNWIELPVN